MLTGGGCQSNGNLSPGERNSRYPSVVFSRPERPPDMVTSPTPDPPVQSGLAAARRLLDLHRATEAEALLRAACAEGQGDSPEVRMALAFALLQQGRYPEGFAELEHRDGRRTAKVRQLPTPEWDGSPLAGRSILVWTEQGIGDEIMLARFIPRLREAGAARIFLGCLPSNVRAFGQLGLDGVFARFRPEGGRIAIPAHDCWTLLFSLPHRLRVTREGLCGAPYLIAEPRRRGGIGIVERGHPDNPRDADRSIPDGLLRRALPEAALLAPEGDLQDSLARVAGLDLLVTVDTSWAHMAGALGVPCWLLLPAERADWRWLPAAERTPWYDSLRLFWQQAPGDWSHPIGEVWARLAANRRAGAAVGA